MNVNIKRVQHVSIPISPGGAEAARGFYGDVLGLAEKQVPASLDAETLTWFAVGEDGHEIHCFVDSAFVHRTTGAHLCLQVEDIAALRNRITERGVEFDHDPTPIHNRPRSFVRDPFGNLIEFTQIDGQYEGE
jgi:catechol 2,3-dioxygenase-like lactoylglutathione lyase family enzyme